MQFDRNKRGLFKASIKISSENSLPWVADASKFVDLCTQCGDCIGACPENIIVKGDGGFPQLNFELGECSFCSDCADICKEPIFIPTTSSPWNKQAVINQQCLANQSIYCRSCAESCETQALIFQIGISAVPTISNELCTGCGACVAPCPVNAIEIKELK